ncbi:MAG TPA: hypothetical protein P5543_05140 [Planctomycetota bacterium]|nr:hypothetical protein [Planctomycetota bacterium]
MKKSILIIFLCMIMGTYVISEERTSQIQKAVLEQFHVYPHSTLQDYYKNFFQDCFGPGHLITDLQTAHKYLQNELEQTPLESSILYEKTGWRGNYYRVSLSLIKKNIIPYHIFFDSFVKSVHGIQPPTHEEWIEEWNEIQKIIENLNLPLINYEQDKQFIQEKLQKKQYTIHHSKKYNQHYKPHYRIIEKNIFFSVIFPYLK